MKIRNQVRFYADNAIYKNVSMSYWVNNKKDAMNCLNRFMAKGWSIRAAWYRHYNRIGQLSYNERLK